MSLNRLFDSIEHLRESAHWRSAFGEAQTMGDKTIIPVSKVWYGFGLGFGQSTTAPEGLGRGTEPELADGEQAAEGGEGGGAGGAGGSRPMGALVITEDEVYFEEAGGYDKVALAGMALGGWVIWQIALTLREVFGRR